MSRRGMLAQCANGFGAVALAALHADPAFANDAALKSSPVQAGHGPASYGSSKKRHLFIYGWRALTSRHVRSETTAR